MFSTIGNLLYFFMYKVKGTETTSKAKSKKMLFKLDKSKTYRTMYLKPVKP